MIFYHKKDDVYNAIYRILGILRFIDNTGVDFIKIRIIDFYLVFPHFLKDFKYKRTPMLTPLKRYLKSIEFELTPYEIMPSKVFLLNELSVVQQQAISILISKNIIRVDKKTGYIYKEALFNNIISRLEYIKNDILLNLIIDYLNPIDLYGENGLKARSGLMEYKYDKI